MKIIDLKKKKNWYIIEYMVIIFLNAEEHSVSTCKVLFYRKLLIPLLFIKYYQFNSNNPPITFWFKK